MGRTKKRSEAMSQQRLEPVCRQCPACGNTMWADYSNSRSVTTLDGIVGLTLKVRRCAQRSCKRFHMPY